MTSLTATSDGGRTAEQNEQRDAILGFGVGTARKSFYPVLQDRLDELARFRRLLDSSTDSIFLVRTAARWQIVDLNAAAARLLASSVEALRHTSLLDRVSDLPGARRHRELRPLKPSESCQRVRLRADDGAEIPVEFTFNRQQDEGAGYLVCIARDIRHQLAWEEELADARDRAVAADRAKSAFLRIMSHELLTPLNPLRALLEVLGEDPRNDFQRDELGMMTSGAERLEQLVQQILLLTRLEAGEVGLESVAFRTCDCCLLLREEYRDRAHALGIELKDSCQGCPWGNDPEFQLVWGDRDKILSVLRIFVDNALKFTDRGEITTRSQTTWRGDGQLWLRIMVQDNGCGIPPDQLEAIFKPFGHADARLARSYEGAGLSLAIARGLANLMGGEVGAQSMENRGSVFWLELPLALGADATPVSSRAQQARSVDQSSFISTPGATGGSGQAAAPHGSSQRRKHARSCPHRSRG